MLWPLLDIDARGARMFLWAAKGYAKTKNLRMSTEDQPAYHNQPAQTSHRHMMDALRHLAVQHRYGVIDDQCLSGSAMVRAYHRGGGPYSRWKRFNRGRRS